MNTGDVQPYSWTGMMNPDAMAATAFNAASHAKTDSNWDATFLVSYTPSSQATYELGYARKTRTPNLYERYSWGRGSMSSRMVGWFGDGNGYVGDLALKPETAHTFSATGGWKGDRWALKVTPYYTRIENYIGVRKLQSFTDMMGMPTVFVQLQFVNHEAEIYGVDVSGSLSLWDSKNTGKADLKLATSWVDGKDLTSGTNLYHFMPVNAKITLDHSLGAWSSSAELVLVAEKSEIDSIRNEPRTAGYALLNLQGSYTRGQLRFDAGIKNLFNSAYDLPLGGVSLGDNKATGQLRPVPGMGRSFNFAVTAGF
jgi:iron complex outermembrane receptor protein